MARKRKHRQKAKLKKQARNQDEGREAESPAKAQDDGREAHEAEAAAATTESAWDTEPPSP